MQIPSISSSPQAILSNVSQNQDGSQQTTGSVGGTSSPDDSSQVSGVESSSEAVQTSQQSVQETTDSQQTAPVQVVTTADEALGTSLGLNINTTA